MDTKAAFIKIKIVTEDESCKMEGLCSDDQAFAIEQLLNWRNSKETGLKNTEMGKAMQEWQNAVHSFFAAAKRFRAATEDEP